MKKKLFYLIGIVILTCFGYSCSDDDDSTTETIATNGMIIDHTCTSLSKIPDSIISKVASKLYIAYNSSWDHGSEITYGLRGLVSFGGSKYGVDEYGEDGRLRFDAYEAFGNVRNIENHDNDSAWYVATRDTLIANKRINVVMWCWEEGVTNAKSSDIERYLKLMSQLEKDFPSVKFVYMTGHLDGTSSTDNLYLRNEQIRKYCKDNKKILYDFADIESYDPDGVNYGDKLANDTCGYDSNADGKIDKNWARTWQMANNTKIKWYDCGYNDNGDKYHPLNLNANLKAYAAWWMFARIAGWAGPTK